MLLICCGLASGLAEEGRNSFFLMVEAEIKAGIREYVVYASDLTELADIPHVYVKQLNSNIDPPPAKTFVV